MEPRHSSTQEACSIVQVHGLHLPPLAAPLLVPLAVPLRIDHDQVREVRETIHLQQVHSLKQICH